MKKLSDLELINKINLIGQTQSPKFSFVSFDGKTKRNRRKIVIKNELEETRSTVVTEVMRGKNPFKSGSLKYTHSILENIVNELGRKNKPKYRFVGIAGTYSNYAKKLSIKNADTNEIRVLKLEQLKRLSNPFDSKIPDQLELFEAQPKYEKLFKSMKITYYKNYRLNTKIIDFAFKCPFSGKLYGLEVKHDKKNSYNKKQIEDYKSISKLPPYHFAGILLSSPNGKYGISIKDFKNALKNNTLDKNLC